MSKERSARAKTQVPELLAPAGGPAAFYAALAAGADAIYCGLGSRFNARRGAGNFEDADFAEACRTAHLAGARVYVTENVVIKTDEVPAALALVKRAWDLGADAVILQDWGLMAEVRRQLPEVEVHVSTQANVHDARAVAWCRDVLGVGRVTLSRELSLREIARIAQEGVELENFGHGALCFCYSGVCKMSALGGDRSANRGMCAQPCRLPYDLVDEQGASIAAPDRGRPLCPKDYRTIDHLAELADAGLGSLKVEGRMKAPDYVWGVVCAYRAALDALTEGRELDAAEGQRLATLLKRSFNRDFTDAYLYGRSGDEMMSYDRSNNRGELVGVVTGARDLGTYRRVRGGSDGGRIHRGGRHGPPGLARGQGGPAGAAAPGGSLAVPNRARRGRRGGGGDDHRADDAHRAGGQPRAGHPLTDRARRLRAGRASRGGAQAPRVCVGDRAYRCPACH